MRIHTLSILKRQSPVDKKMWNPTAPARRFVKPIGRRTPGEGRRRGPIGKYPELPAEAQPPGLSGLALHPAGNGSRPFLMPALFLSPHSFSPIAFFPRGKAGISRKEGQPLLSTGDEQLCLHKYTACFPSFLCKTTSPTGSRQQQGREKYPFLLKKLWFRRISVKIDSFFPDAGQCFRKKSEKRPSEKAASLSFTQNPLKTFLYFV